MIAHETPPESRATRGYAPKAERMVRSFRVDFLVLGVRIAFADDAAAAVHIAHLAVENAGAQGHGKLAVAGAVHETAGSRVESAVVGLDGPQQHLRLPHRRAGHGGGGMQVFHEVGQRDASEHTGAGRREQVLHVGKPHDLGHWRAHPRRSKHGRARCG